MLLSFGCYLSFGYCCKRTKITRRFFIHPPSPPLANKSVILSSAPSVAQIAIINATTHLNRFVVGRHLNFGRRQIQIGNVRRRGGGGGGRNEIHQNEQHRRCVGHRDVRVGRASRFRGVPVRPTDSDGRTDGKTDGR